MSKPNAQEERYLRACMSQLRGYSVIRLRQAKEVIDDNLTTSVPLEQLRELFIKMGIREHEPDSRGVAYEGKEVEEKIWSKLTGSTPELWGTEASNECDHKGSVMFGGLCSCRYNNDGGSGLAPGSSISLEAQKAAIGIAHTEPEHFEGKM